MSYLEKGRLDGEVAVVTGGGRAIGLCCVDALAEAGASVFVIERTEAEAEPALALRGKGLEVNVRTGDVTDPGRMDAIAAEMANSGRPATILVNNAGIGMFGVSAETISTDDWLRMMDVNLNGVFYCARAFGRYMIDQGRGAVVNIGSMSGFIANRPESHAAYNTSKAAVHHLTRCLAVDWAPYGVRVNAVAPTYIETPMTMANPENYSRFAEWRSHTPMGRMGQPEEVASAVLYLASSASSLTTGAVLKVDGGYTCW